MSQTTPLNVLVVGLGLIGGSFAKALRQAKAAYVFGLDQDTRVAQRALTLGIIDEVVPTTHRPPHFDVLVLAVPVLAMPRLLAELKPYCGPETVITDVGSVKNTLVEAAGELWQEIPSGLVPGHPIAGAEHSGVEAARADLFVQQPLILTPLATSSLAAIQLLTQLWQSVGAQVSQMSVAEHDEVLAATSHLPHLLAFSLIDTLAGQSKTYDIFRYAASGLGDFSRIAASDPTMWHDIFLANRSAVLTILQRFQVDLMQLTEALEREDSAKLMAVFKRSQAARNHFTEVLRLRTQSTMFDRSADE